MELPPGYESGLVAGALPNGKLSVTMLINREAVGAIEIDAEQAGVFAASFLAAAMVSQERTNLPLPESHSENPLRPEIAPSKAAMWESQTPDTESLVLTFGQAQISIVLSPDLLQVLGNNMLKLAGPSH